MKRAQLNFAVDVAIAVAFLVAAVTGILFLLPAGTIRVLGLGMPGMLGVSLRTWHWLHDWSGVVATVGVLVHAALHYRWIVNMTRCTFGSSEIPARRAARARAATPAGALATSGRRPEASAARAAARPPDSRHPHLGDTAHGDRPIHRAGRTERLDRRRITRRRFVAGAAAGLGVAFLGGALLPRLGADAAKALQGSGGTQSSGDATKSSGGSTGSGATDTTGSGSSGSGSSGSGASASGAGSASAAPGGSTAAVLVSVDSSSCVGCGRCLNVCPAGVFAWDASGSHALARNASRCIRCHRCLQTCPASAITVSA
jgi:NAD-dependent dihydropyrimidine dehydrogenase PreA subunit